MKKEILILLVMCFVSVVYAQNNSVANLQVQAFSDNAAWLEWDENNPIIDASTGDTTILQFRIRYREVGASVWTSKTKIYDYNQYPTTRKRLKNLIADTQYEFQMKSFFRDGTNSGWGSLHYFTTNSTCNNIINFTANPKNPTRVEFNWDLNGVSLFTRIKYRENNSATGWFNAGGSGVYYPIQVKVKNGLTPGQSYRGQARTWCGNTYGIPYRSSGWTSLVYWTQPSNTQARLMQASKRNILRVTDLFGRNSQVIQGQPLIYYYDDGIVEKRIVIE